jgi:adenine phosphoribosyltransferase
LIFGINRFCMGGIEENSNYDLARRSIRTIPDYPKKGIMFRDVTTLLKDARAFAAASNLLVARCTEFPEFGYVAGIESRGFIFGSVLAQMLGKGFVPIRKPGKLPGKVRSIDYELEYGRDTLEVHLDAIIEGESYLVLDDLLATGGTASASCQLIEECGGLVSGCLFLVELPDLGGRDKLNKRIVSSVIQFEGE